MARPPRRRPLLAALGLLSAARTRAQSCNATLPLPAHTIAQFAPADATNNFTFFENVVARANGDLLVAMVVPAADVFLLRDAGAAAPCLTRIFTVPGVNGTDGIVEVAARPDVFAVVAGNISLGGDPANGVAGSWSLWEMDLGDGDGKPPVTPGQQQPQQQPDDAATAGCSAADGPRPPAVRARKIADMPQAPRLNGAAAIPGTTAVLVGDSQLGVAFRVDTVTGAVAQALDLAEMKPVPGAGSVDDALGLNGMKIGRASSSGGEEASRLYLYFTNAAARTVNRVAILPDGTGPAPDARVERIAEVREAGWLDDLDLRDDGSLWVTTNSPTNSLLAIRPKAGGAGFDAPSVVLGANNSLTIAGPSAAVFGRGRAGTRNMYVVTGSGDEPAKVVRVDTSSCQ